MRVAMETDTDADSLGVFTSEIVIVFEKVMVAEMVARIDVVVEQVRDALGADLLEDASAEKDKDPVRGMTTLNVSDGDSEEEPVSVSETEADFPGKVALRETVPVRVGDKDLDAVEVNDLVSLPERVTDAVRCRDRVEESVPETEPAETVV